MQVRDSSTAGLGPDTAREMQTCAVRKCDQVMGENWMHSCVYGLGAIWHMSHVPTEFPLKEATFFSQRVSKDLIEGQVYSLRGSLGGSPAARLWVKGNMSPIFLERVVAWCQLHQGPWEQRAAASITRNNVK